jgi:hypothetical protein
MRSLCLAAVTLALITTGRAALAQGGPVATPPATATTPGAVPAPSLPEAPPPPPMPGIIVQVPAPVGAPSDPAERLASMQLLMERLADPSRRYRLVGGFTALGLGALTVPVSAVMLARGSSTEIGPVILLGIGMGEVIGGGFVLATPGTFASGYAPIVDRIVSGQKAGEPAEKTLLAAERVWHDRAEAARDGRHALGGIALVVGTIATGVGIALDAANPIGGLARSDQDGFSAAAFGVGYAAILSGVRTLVFPTPVEQSWEVYRGGAAPPAPTAARVVLTGLGPVSVRGGVGMGWGTAF